MNTQLVSALFDTDALRICPQDTPFWYTSGKLGPFYINTHFLYGSEQEANALLAEIEAEAAEDRTRLPERIAEKAMAQYEKNAIYRSVIDALAAAAKGMEFDLVSGGERRDFFFSLPVARLLNKPHVSIYKDRSAVYTPAEFTGSKPAGQAALAGKSALHIADLVTEASSYLRQWLPALQALKITLKDTLVVIDRDQGGSDVLAREGVALTALLTVDGALLQAAQGAGKLTGEQAVMVADFLAHPASFTADFVAAHPDFLDAQIALGGKAKERALLCMEKGFHLPQARV